MMQTGVLRELSCSNCGAPLVVTETSTVVTCEYCKRAHAYAPAPAPSQRSVLRGSYAPDDSVRIEWGGRWWPGRVVRVVADDAWEVAYDGWASNWNEVVGPQRLARVDDSLDVATPAASNVGHDAYRVGDAVLVKWKNRWWNARIVRLAGDGTWEISYDGYSASWNEVVGPERVQPNAHGTRTPTNARGASRGPGGKIAAGVVVLFVTFVVTVFVVNVRRPSAGEHVGESAPGDPVRDATSVPAGTAVVVSWQGGWYPAHVVRIDGTGLRVHYDSFADSWDETVPLDRVHRRR